MSNSKICHLLAILKNNMKLSEELVWRGFVQQTTLTDLKQLDGAPSKVFYHGFDASADSQTVGNLAAMMLDKLFIRHGYKAILLAGGATSLIGDPGGKDKERPLQDEKTVAHNIKNAEKQLHQIFDGQDFTLVDNLDWYKDMGLLEFLRDVGKHFSMTPLVQRDYIANRMGEGGAGISYTEFSYTLLQGYDFLKLYRDHGVTLQLSGSDQWGNGISGVDLVRRVEGAETHIITMPLIINKATGKKFGKTEEGAIWLDPAKTSVYAFYQFWLNVDDESAEDYLKIFTSLSKVEVDDIIGKFNQHKSDRLAQKTLAYEVTKLVHGKDRADSVRKVTEVLFGSTDISELDEADIELLSAEIPVVSAEKSIVTTLVSAGLASSNGEAIRLISGGGVTINGHKSDKDDIEFFKTGYNLLRRGKNGFAIVKL